MYQRTPGGATRVRVMVARDGTVVNVTRVDEHGRVRSVIWQRAATPDEGPFRVVLEGDADDLAERFARWLEECRCSAPPARRDGWAGRFAAWLSSLRPARPATSP